MSLRLRLYIVAIAVGAIGLLALDVPHQPPVRWLVFVLWIGICLASESLQVPSYSGDATVTMASTAGLAAIMLWGRGAGMIIGVVSTAIGYAFILRKPLIRVLFNSSQIAVTSWAAATVFTLLGGPVNGFVDGGGHGTGDVFALRLMPALLGLILTYFLLNRVLVNAAVAWSTERPYWRALRQDWIYLERVSQDFSAFLLSPLMVVAFMAIGYVGVALFVVPLRLLNESAKRYLELQRAQNQIIHTERMAAKGEMAAEVGHELRNQLAAISGRAQMLLRDAAKQSFANIDRHAQIILDQAQRMERLSKGLMDFSGAEPKMERVDVNGLIQRTIEFVRTQNRFDNVEWEIQLCDPAPELRADPGQLQQVLLNLFMNAADAMRDRDKANAQAAANGTAPKAVVTPLRRWIGVQTERDERHEVARILVRDSGPGIPTVNLNRVFEPHFTTKADGHGFGLSTSYRIVTTHGGKIVAESPIGHGATFTITMPLPGPGTWR